MPKKTRNQELEELMDMAGTVKIGQPLRSGKQGAPTTAQPMQTTKKKKKWWEF